MERFTKKLQEQPEASDSGYLSENLSALQSGLDVASGLRVAEPSGDSGINLDYSRSQSLDVWKEIYKQDDNGDTLLHLRLATADSEDRISLNAILLDYLRATPHPDLLEIVNDWGQTALHVACEHEDVRSARTLICAGAVANRSDYMHYTPLHIAASKGNYELLKAIIDPVTTEEISDLGLTLYGVTPSAVRTKFNEVSLLCSQGVTPLHLAVASGNRELLEELLSLASDFDAQELLEGRTALHLAADLRRPDMLLLLLRRGASINALDYGGKTALARVLEQRYVNSSCQQLDEILLLLRAHGAQEPEDQTSEDSEDEEHHCGFQECAEVTCF